MNSRTRAGLALLWAALMIGGSAGAARAQGSGPSDLTISKLMSYAWAITPAKFTAPDARVIEIDKTKRKEVEITKEAAIDIIRGGYRTYEADLCGLAEEAAANYGTVMLRAKQKFNLTDQQYVYANQLHLATLQYSKGGLRITGTEDNKVVELLAIPPRDPKECTAERLDRVKKAVSAFISDTSAPAPAKRAEPASSVQKK
jgi:hypothetical protein